jgi:ribosomal protein S18 acetylase RimI-like enzyme
VISYQYSNEEDDLLQILKLQSSNLMEALDASEAKTEGFVTVHHDLDLLKTLGQEFPHTLAKDGKKVLAYALSMPPSCANTIEVLQPMFKVINALTYHGKRLANTNYIVMGQVCVDKAYRKQGVFRNLYNAMCKQLRGKVEYIITKVSQENERSLQAHLAIGFKVLHTFETEGKNWDVIILPVIQ